jgi:hypothetical protein
MMEKYDGERVYWDGSNLHWKDTVIIVPQNLQFPTVPFEGELW